MFLCSVVVWPCNSFVSAEDLPGKAIAAQIISGKADVKAQRQATRRLAQGVNEAKRTIDELDAALVEKRRDGVTVAAAAVGRVGAAGVFSFFFFPFETLNCLGG